MLGCSRLSKAITDRRSNLDTASSRRLGHQVVFFWQMVSERRYLFAYNGAPWALTEVCAPYQAAFLSNISIYLRVHAAHVILEEILAANAPGCREAEGFLGQAVCRLGKEVKLLDPAGLEALACICDEALAMLPIQTRHRDADPRIIQWIFEDLIEEHGTEHYILGELMSATGESWTMAMTGRLLAQSPRHSPLSRPVPTGANSETSSAFVTRP